jgi:hypothetical protein
MAKHVKYRGRQQRDFALEGTRLALNDEIAAENRARPAGL